MTLVLTHVPRLLAFHSGKTNERRFFYTSADHLRNSFSHIPSHMAECTSCPQEVKTRLEELKALRNKQKNRLKNGYHKIFIDRVWQRIHGPALTDDDMSASESEDEEAHVSPKKTTQRKAPPSEAKAKNTLLVHEADKSSTTDLTYFTLLQVLPYKTVGQSEQDEEEDSREIGFPGVICSHCNKKGKGGRNGNGGRKFFTTSSEHFGDLLLTISNHMAICKECPGQVKAQLETYRATHETQLAGLKQGENRTGEHDMCIDRVWKRLVALNREAEEAKPAPKIPTQYRTVDPNMSLVSVEDESLVTPFTYTVLTQVRACNLDNSCNGSRSAFDLGFPGLECIHCAGQRNARRFFYRTAEILSGNYAHIPNHLLSCSAVPPSIKRSLREMKEAHNTLKHTLPKGSQKEFFQNVWNRLHSVAIPQNNNPPAAAVMANVPSQNNNAAVPPPVAAMSDAEAASAVPV